LIENCYIIDNGEMDLNGGKPEIVDSLIDND